MESLKQLPLNISLAQESTFANFVVGDNQQLIQSLQAFDDSTHWCLLLFGEIGKTHLLQATCQAAHKQQISNIYLPLSELQTYSPTVLDNLEQYQLLVLDDVDVVLDEPAWSEQLFHLYNRVSALGHRLLMSSSLPLAELNSALADLNSRLHASTVYQIMALSDDEKKILMQRRAQQLGMHLSDDVIEFLLRRAARSISALTELVDKLDRASLIQKRKLTVPFVKEVLSQD